VTNDFTRSALAGPGVREFFVKNMALGRVGVPDDIGVVVFFSLFRRRPLGQRSTPRSIRRHVPVKSSSHCAGPYFKCQSGSDSEYARFRQSQLIFLEGLSNEHHRKSRKRLALSGQKHAG
jgi:hypothetical protein